MTITEIIITILLPLSGLHIALLILALTKLAKIEGMVPDIHRRLDHLETHKS